MLRLEKELQLVKLLFVLQKMVVDWRLEKIV